MIGRMLDRYILKQIIPFYLLSVAGFVLFFITADAFERIDVFVDNHTPMALIIRYYVAGSVYNAVVVSPISLLLAIFIVLGQMTRFNEVTAMKTAGLSLYRIFAPVWLLALVISGGCWWVADAVMPHANQLKKEIYNEKIRGRPPRTGGVRMNLNYLGPEGRIWAVRRFDVRRKELQEAVIQDFGRGQLLRRVDARRATWSTNHWVFYDGVVRTFTEASETAAPFDSTVLVELSETPEDLARDEADPFQMASAELATFVKRLGQSGRPTAKYETERHLKFSYPLVNLMVALLALPLATRLRRGGIAIGFALSFLLFVLYVCMVRLGQILGHNGQMPPMLAAWLGNIVFGATGAVLLIRAPK